MRSAGTTRRRRKAAPATMPATTPSAAVELRRIGLLLSWCRRLLGSGLRRRRLPRGRLLCRCRTLPRRRGRRLADGPKRALQVVEHEPDSRCCGGRRSEPAFPVDDDEDTAVTGRDLHLRQGSLAGAEAVCVLEQTARTFRERVGARLVDRR